jgi:hypothetical protein
MVIIIMMEEETARDSQHGVAWLGLREKKCLGHAIALSLLAPFAASNPTL